MTGHKARIADTVDIWWASYQWAVTGRFGRFLLILWHFADRGLFACTCLACGMQMQILGVTVFEGALSAKFTVGSLLSDMAVLSLRIILRLSESLQKCSLINLQCQGCFHSNTMEGTTVDIEDS